VDYLVEGSVNREAETVHVIAKLIEAASGKQLWSGSFQGTTDRPFSAQQNIAGSVAGFLEMSIGDPRRHGGTTNFAAYDALLRAGDEDDLDVALMLLDEALAHDPKFAVAMVSKAELYWWLMWANRETPQQAWVMAEPLLQNALAVSDDFGIAHAILGGFQITQNDYESAEASLQRALKINPSDTFALGRLSQLYVRTGRITEGIALQERVVRVDPMQSGQHRMLAARKVAGGDIDGAIESFERAISLDPGNSGTWFQYGSQIRDAKGDLFPFQLMERFQREGREPGEPLVRAPRLIRNLGLWFAIIEDYARATKMLYLAQDISDSSWIRLDLAGIALQKGDFDKAWSDAWLALEGMPRNDMLASWAGEIALIRGTGRERVLAHYREYWPELFGDAPVVDGIIPNLALAAAFILREEGDEANATALLDALLTQSGPDSITPAIVLAASGEIEAALDTLEAAATAGASISPNRLLIEFIGNEPRLIELLRPEQEEKARVRTEVNAIIERGNIILPTAENLSP
jgi:tetratricopeptide (TPR) repeat protein